MGERLLCKQEVAGSIPAGSIPESLATAPRRTGGGADYRPATSATHGVLLLCIPGAFVLKGNGPWLLLLLMVAGRVPRIRRARRDAKS